MKGGVDQIAMVISGTPITTMAWVVMGGCSERAYGCIYHSHSQQPSCPDELQCIAWSFLTSLLVKADHLA